MVDIFCISSVSGIIGTGKSRFTSASFEDDLMCNILKSGEYPSILNDIIGNPIEDILVPIIKGPMQHYDSPVITYRAFCVVYGGGRRVYLHITVIETDACDSMIIEAQSSFSLLKYPGGPSYEWGSILYVLGPGELIISKIDTLSNKISNDDNCYDGDGVILNTEGDRVLCFIPNPFPEWIDFLYSKIAINKYSCDMGIQGRVYF